MLHYITVCMVTSFDRVSVTHLLTVGLLRLKCNTIIVTHSNIMPDRLYLQHDYIVTLVTEQSTTLLQFVYCDFNNRLGHSTA